MIGSPPAGTRPLVQPAPRLVATGNSVLDDGLGGGIPAGSLLLVDGEAGAGASEFALSVLRNVGKDGRSAARYASILRSPQRVAREADDLFPEGHRIAPIALGPAFDASRCLVLANELGAGDVLVFESAAGFAHAVGPEALVAMVRDLAEVAERSKAVILLLHTPTTLPPALEARIMEVVDGALSFVWREGGPMRRRFLRVVKVRGLVPMLENEEVPVYEVGLRRGAGFAISRVKNVI